jgi:hypothetical protein
VINYWLAPAAQGDVVFEIADDLGKLTQRYTVKAAPGAGKLEWDLRFVPDEPPGAPGGRGRGGGAQGVAGPGRTPRPSAGGFGGGRGTMAAPGTYRVKMTVNGKTFTRSVTVRADPGGSD